MRAVVTGARGFVGPHLVAGGRVRSVDESSRTVIAELWVTVERDGRPEFAIRKGEEDLRLAFNEAIDKIRKDGTYQAIAAKYFDFDVYGPEA